VPLPLLISFFKRESAPVSLMLTLAWGPPTRLPKRDYGIREGGKE